MTTAREGGRDVSGGGSGGGGGAQPASAMASRQVMHRTSSGAAEAAGGGSGEDADAPVMDPFVEMDRLPSLKSRLWLPRCGGYCTRLYICRSPFRAPWALWGSGLPLCPSCADIFFLFVCMSSCFWCALAALFVACLNVRVARAAACATQEDRQRLFIKKLNLCEAQVDWSNPRADLGRKESKRRTLVDVVELASSGYPYVFTPEVHRPLIASVSANLFRALPVGSATDDGLDAEDDEPRLEPAWPHVQVSYEVLRRFIVSNETDPKVACAVVDQHFVASLLQLFDSEDPREREYLKTILHRVYGKFMPLRVFIRRSITHTFHRFVYETQRQRTATAYRHHGAAELLEILGSIINGFTLPLKQEHKMFLRRTLLPLHVPKSLPSYHGQLSFCITQFVEKDPTLAVDVISGLLKLWPQTATRKAVLCLGELEEVLELTRPAQFAAVLPQLFRQISACIESPHFQIAERALFFWNNEYIVNLIVHHRERVVPFVFGALQRNAEDHWNPNVRSLSYNVQKLLAEMDNSLYQRAAALYITEKDSSEAREHQRASSWMIAESLAAARLRQMRGLSSAATDVSPACSGEGPTVSSTVSPISSAALSGVVAPSAAVLSAAPLACALKIIKAETPSSATATAEPPLPPSSLPVAVPKSASSASVSSATSPPMTIAVASLTADVASVTMSSSSTPAASTKSTTSPVSVVDAPVSSVLVSPSSLEPQDVASSTNRDQSSSVGNVDATTTSPATAENAAATSPLLAAPPPWTPPTLRAAESRSMASDSSDAGRLASPASVSRPAVSAVIGGGPTCATTTSVSPDESDNSSRQLRAHSQQPGSGKHSDGHIKRAASSRGAKNVSNPPSSLRTGVGATKSRRTSGSSRPSKATASAVAAAASAAIAAAFPSVSSPERISRRSDDSSSASPSSPSSPKDVPPLTAAANEQWRPRAPPSSAHSQPKATAYSSNSSAGTAITHSPADQAPRAVTANGRQASFGDASREA